MQEIVDNLRAEIAETRATILSLKKKGKGSDLPKAGGSTASFGDIGTIVNPSETTEAPLSTANVDEIAPL